MLLSFVIIILYCVTKIWGSTSSCPGTIASSNGACYVFRGPRDHNYENAKNYCENKEMIMASMETEELYHGFIEMVDLCKTMLLSIFFEWIDCCLG